MAGLKIGKLQGATLVETIVSMTIILVIFIIISTIFMQLASTTRIEKIKAEAIINRYVLNTDENENFFDEEIEIENFTVRRIPQPCNEAGLAKCFMFEIQDQTGKIVTRQFRIFSEK